MLNREEEKTEDLAALKSVEVALNDLIQLIGDNSSMRVAVEVRDTEKGYPHVHCRLDNLVDV